MRRFTAADVEPVRWVVYRAYAQVLLDLYGADAAAQYEVRSRRFMAMYLDRDPHGCFLAEAADGSPVGAVFCFVWGEVGWFGSLAVAPERQGEGIGQRLTAAAVGYLAERGCRRIGLETWPDLPLVEHLYGKFGFRSYRSTVKLSRAAAHRPALAGFTPRWLDGGTPASMAAAQAAVRAVTVAQMAAAPGEPVPDYAHEVRTPMAAGWAEPLVMDGPAAAPVALALCYLRKPSGAHVAALDTRLLLVGPGAEQEAALDAVLAALDARALALGVASVTCDVNLRYARAAALLRERGFASIYELVRMERPTPGFDPHAESALIEYARWAG